WLCDLAVRIKTGVHVKAFLIQISFLMVCGFFIASCGNNPADGGSGVERQGKPGDKLDTVTKCDVAFNEFGLCGTIFWSERPKVNQKNEFLIKFWNASSATSDGPYENLPGPVSLTVWMPSMGHGSSSDIKLSVDSSGKALTGVYQVSEVYFTMPGRWEIWVQVKRGETVVKAKA